MSGPKIAKKEAVWCCVDWGGTVLSWSVALTRRESIKRAIDAGLGRDWSYWSANGVRCIRAQLIPNEATS